MNAGFGGNIVLVAGGTGGLGRAVAQGAPIAFSTCEQASSQRRHCSPHSRQCSWWSAWRSPSRAQIAQISQHEATFARALSAS
jgi:hypothetical protein